MSAGWVAGSVRARLLLGRRLGRDGREAPGRRRVPGRPRGARVHRVRAQGAGGRHPLRRAGRGGDDAARHAVCWPAGCPRAGSRPCARSPAGSSSSTSRIGSRTSWAESPSIRSTSAASPRPGRPSARRSPRAICGARWRPRPGAIRGARSPTTSTVRSCCPGLAASRRRSRSARLDRGRPRRPARPRAAAPRTRGAPRGRDRARARVGLARRRLGCGARRSPARMGGVAPGGGGAARGSLAGRGRLVAAPRARRRGDGPRPARRTEHRRRRGRAPGGGRPAGARGARGVRARRSRHARGGSR